MVRTYQGLDNFVKLFQLISSSSFEILMCGGAEFDRVLLYHSGQLVNLHVQ